MRKGVKKMICASLALTLISSVMSFTTKPVEAALYSAYVMGYFKETPNGSGNSPNLYLAVSKDGLNWTPLNQNNYVLKPTEGTGYLRDPFFLRKQDGTFVIVATDNWNSEYIHIWDSANLTDFTNERLVRMNTSGMHAWAPETFYDASKGQYAVIWSGNTDRNRIYVNYTKDFVNFTSPKVYFDPGF
ncbi:alpha-L-arabinofuranosidase, partial [Lachnotalea glycerini]